MAACSDNPLEISQIMIAVTALRRSHWMAAQVPVCRRGCCEMEEVWSVEAGYGIGIVSAFFI